MKLYKFVSDDGVVLTATKVYFVGNDVADTEILLMTDKSRSHHSFLQTRYRWTHDRRVAAGRAM